MEEKELSVSETVRNVLNVLKRRLWWIILPATVIGLGAIGIVMLLPHKYESEATLVVIQQRIAQRFVEPTLNTSVLDTFYGMSREVLSRHQLAKVITEFDLYQDARKENVPIELLTERLRKEIKVQPEDLSSFGEIISFKITFRAESAELASNITSRLAGLFIEENLRKRSGQATTTTRFLADQIEHARLRLAKQEEKIRDYKRINLEALPQQQQTLLASLTDLRIQLQATTAGLTRLQQQKNAIQSLLGNHLGKLQSERQTLLAQYTARHPDILKKDEEIQRTQLLLARLLKQSSSSESADIGPGFDGPQLGQLRAQVETTLAETAHLSREQDRLSGEIARQHGTLKQTPVHEQELIEIQRDYDLYKKDYEDLLSKQMNAQLSATLEERNEGQQYRLVDPPTMPRIPSWPKRLPISLAGLGAGLAVGVALAFIIDAKVNAFYTEMEIRSKYTLPIVAAIPYMHTIVEEQRLPLKMWGERIAVLTVILTIVSAEVYVYFNQ